ncbi:MAG: sigma-70 family RNA polymerase sigma factor [Anaerolineales bacterium]
MEEDDRIAVCRLKRGDWGGLDTLVERYQLKAVRAAFLILRDVQAAEDVTQETFIKVARHIKRFDERRPFAPYFLRSVVNAALDMAILISRQERASIDIEFLEERLIAADTVESEAEWNTVKRDVQHALEQLSPRQRAAIVMRYYLDLSEKEMAAQMNARPGTVKWLLNEARARLRDMLGVSHRRSVK